MRNMRRNRLLFQYLGLYPETIPRARLGAEASHQGLGCRRNSSRWAWTSSLDQFLDPENPQDKGSDHTSVRQQMKRGDFRGMTNFEKCRRVHDFEPRAIPSDSRFFFGDQPKVAKNLLL